MALTGDTQAFERLVAVAALAQEGDGSLTLGDLRKAHISPNDQGLKKLFDLGLLSPVPRTPRFKVAEGFRELALDWRALSPDP
jgi:hypothetical protein